MTADWKKPPLQRGKRYSDIQRLQARVKELEDALEVNLHIPPLLIRRRKQ